ncbi:hypothetical protein CLOP_g168, partial [Closterium sp. NIES-67]
LRPALLRAASGNGGCSTLAAAAAAAAAGVAAGSDIGAGSPGKLRKMQSWKNKAVVMCSNNFCRRTSPGDGPTCRWHVRNYGSEDDPVNVTLCNACKINFDQGKYCPFCVQIYRERDPDSFDKKQWIGCTNRNCRRWSHEDCEMEYGIDVSKIDRRSYQCPGCRDAGKHSDANERRRLGRHNAADRLAIAQAAAAAAEAGGGASAGEKDRGGRGGSGGGGDKGGGSPSPARILFGGGGSGGGSVPSGRRKSRQSSGGGAAAAGGRNGLLAAAAAAAIAAVGASPVSPLGAPAPAHGAEGGGRAGAGGGAGGGGKGAGGGRGSSSVKVLFKGDAARGRATGGEGEAVKSDEGGSGQHGSSNDTDSDTFPGLQDSLRSPNPSSDSTPGGDQADSANRVDHCVDHRVDQSKPETAVDQRIHPVDHIDPIDQPDQRDQIDQIDPMDTADDERTGGVEEEGEAEAARKASSGGGNHSNSQDNSNSEHGWRKSPVGAAAAAAASSGLPRSSKRVQASTKPLKVDLSKLQTSSLKRYKRVYKLRDASSGKEELKIAVAQHFASLVVSEEEIIHSLVEVFSRRYHQRAAANATAETPAAAAAVAAAANLTHPHGAATCS